MKTLLAFFILLPSSFFLQAAPLAGGAATRCLASWTDAAGMTCATWDYPFGTKLLVTEIHNHLSVIVTVNDRGPARRLVRAGRRIDLSAAAFEKLAGLALGLAEVTIQPIRSSGRKPAPIKRISKLP